MPSYVAEKTQRVPMTDTKSDNFAYSLLGEFADLEPRALPPLHLWQPTHVSDVDIEIKADGCWYHEGTAITRQRLTRLFSTILRLEDDGDYYLITPAEKCRVQVEIAPFVAVLMTVTGSGQQQVLTLTSNVADEVTVDADHPLSFKATAVSDLTPFVEVRDGLQAIFARNVYYQLMDLLCVEPLPNADAGKVAEDWYGVWSSGTFFAVQRASEVEAR
jgi:hypothetical protein